MRVQRLCFEAEQQPDAALHDIRNGRTEQRIPIARVVAALRANQNCSGNRRVKPEVKNFAPAASLLVVIEM